MVKEIDAVPDIKDRWSSGAPLAGGLLKKVTATIGAHGMFHSGARVLVGVSGGPDSVALLDVLVSLGKPKPGAIGVAHAHHGLRGPAADRDAAFAAELAKNYQLPFFSAHLDVAGYRKNRRCSTEEAGRRLRYDFLNSVAEAHGYHRIALGHHRDDNAELVLMFLLRGSGPRGLSGIPPVREGRIVRPLIDTTRDQILDYLAARRLTWVSDESNTDLRILRNRIRHRLMPQLIREYNPRIQQTLSRLAAIMRCEEQWIETGVMPAIYDAVIKSAAENDRLNLSAEAFDRLSLAARRRVIRKAIRTIKGDLRRITYEHVETVIGLLSTKRVGARCDLPDAVSLEITPQGGTLWRRAGPGRHRPGQASRRSGPAFEYHIRPVGPTDLKEIHLKEVKARLEISRLDVGDLPDLNSAGPGIAFFDYDRLVFPLILRNVLPGDRFQPLGLQGTQKVKKYFIDNKVNRIKRLNCPLLVSGGRIIWLVGHRIDDGAKVTRRTRRVLKAEFFLL